MGNSSRVIFSNGSKRFASDFYLSLPSLDTKPHISLHCGWNTIFPLTLVSPDQPMIDCQGPTNTLYSNQTQIFLSYSNPTRNFLKNDRVASSVYYSHFRKIAARPASEYYSFMDTALVEILSFILSLSSATNLVFYIIFNFSKKQNRNLFSAY